jgi:guanylate kinase
MARGPLIIVSGPSGSGKSTLIKGVMVRWPGRLELAVSATTRQPRQGEEEGRDYHFWTPERFRQAIDAGEFLEYACVHGNNYYGTPRSEVEPRLERGVGVFLDVDVQGADKVRPLYPDHLSVFVKLPALWVYCQRLEERGDSPENIVRRLGTAINELAQIGKYQAVIVNEDREVATADLERLVRERFPGWLPG